MTRYLKDTAAFWNERGKARESLDKERRSAPYQEKIVIAGKLQADTMALKNAKVVKSKSAPKQPKT